MALVYNDLVFRKWWTNASVSTNAAGSATVRGFKGSYKVTAVLGNRSTTSTVMLTGNNSVEIVLN